VAVVGGLALVAGRLAWPDDPSPPPVAPPPPVAAAQPPEMLYRPPLVWVAAARTDAGRPVRFAAPLTPRPAAELAAAEARVLDGLGLAGRLVRRAPASDGCNCHGWVFAGGRYWVNRADVELILADNGYEPVGTPRPGDLAVYRQAGGAIAHTAVVRQAGGRVTVAGKWLWMGVFEHAVADSPYGTDLTYYRSARAGHRVAGWDHPSLPVGGPVPASDLPDAAARAPGLVPTH
jgi:hypothetical protein